MTGLLNQVVKFVFEAAMLVFWKVGAVFFHPKAEMKDVSWSYEGKCVLVIQLNYLGDTLLTLPALHALKEMFPSAKITFMVRHEFYEIVRLQPYLDHVVCTTLGTNRMFGKRFFRDMISLLTLRKRKFDAVVDVSGRFSSAWMSWAMGSPVRVGCKNPGKAAGMMLQDFGWLFTHHIAYTPGTYLAEFHKNVFETSGLILGRNGFILSPPNELVHHCKRILHDQGVTFGRPVVILHAGANHKSRRWTKEGFASLADALAGKLQCDIVFTGSKEDVQRVESIRSAMKGQSFSIAGKTTLVELASMISLCHLFVSTFTGPMHLALLMHVPTIGLSCVDNPRTYFPDREKCAVVHQDSRCGKHYTFFNALKSTVCEDENCECMSTISWESIFQEAKKILEHAKYNKEISG